MIRNECGRKEVSTERDVVLGICIPNVQVRIVLKVDGNVHNTFKVEIVGLIRKLFRRFFD